jgi:aspartate--ammonia ligase
MVIGREDRNVEFLKSVVLKILYALTRTSVTLHKAVPAVEQFIDNDLAFITTQDLEDMYPHLTPGERENEITKKHGNVFLMQIGGKLRSGQPHDGRAPDYDDWSLNGDILVWNPLLDRAFEISSMGIRVDAQSLDKQLKIAGCDDRRELPFHKMLLEDKLPLTIGGGIGQSRICMLLMQKAHIGEVQASVWPPEMLRACEAAGIRLL